jgi:hypothetical protein
VRVTGHHDANVRCERLNAELRHIVDEEDDTLADAHPFGLLEMLRPGSAIVIAAHAYERRQLRKLLENGGAPDISAVENQAAAGQKRRGFGPQQSVSIGDEADADTGSETVL